MQRASDFPVLGIISYFEHDFSCNDNIQLFETAVKAVCDDCPKNGKGS